MIILHNDNEPISSRLRHEAYLIAEMSYVNSREYYHITKSIREGAPLGKRITTATLARQIRWVMNATRSYHIS